LFPFILDSLRGSSVKIGTIQRRLAWPLRKDDTHKSRSVNSRFHAHTPTVEDLCQYCKIAVHARRRFELPRSVMNLESFHTQHDQHSVNECRAIEWQERCRNNSPVQVLETCGGTRSPHCKSGSSKNTRLCICLDCNKRIYCYCTYDRMLLPAA
jgi:hypothetical protein